MKIFTETCCTSLEEALAAQARGTSRIELCVNLAVGGTTPPPELIQDVVGACSIPVNVLIRTTAREFSTSDFVYDDEVVGRMVEEIGWCRKYGAAGVVIGALNPDGSIDMEAMRRMIAAARPLSVTFHRAFDVSTQDASEALEAIIGLGCERLLTSGKEATAWEGRELIARLVDQAGSRLIVMPGSGVKPHNIPALLAATHATEFHGTSIP